MKLKSIKERQIEQIIREMQGNRIRFLSRRQANKFKVVLKQIGIPFSVTYDKHGVIIEIK